MGKHSLVCGRSQMEFDIPCQLVLPEGHQEKLPSNTIEEALKEPYGSNRLEHMAENCSSIAVVLPDATRNWQNVSSMAEAVRNALGSAEKVNWIIGGGQHKLPTEAEKELLLGKALRKKDSVFCCAPEEMVDTFHVTSRGNPVIVHKKVLEADGVVLTGGIIHHELAGFSGGRKGLIPGVSAKKSIVRNHSFCLQKGGINPACDCGKLAGNPVNNDMLEFMSIVLRGKESFLLNVIPDESGLPWRYVAGDPVEAWEEGVEQASALQLLSVEEKADFALVSPGGFPYDMDLYQSTKSVSAVKGAVKKRAPIIMVADLEDGMGPEGYGDLLKKAVEDPAEVLATLENDFTIPSFCALKLVLDSKDNPLALVTKNRNGIFFPGNIYATVEEAVDSEITSSGANATGLLLKAGNCVVVRSNK